MWHQCIFTDHKKENIHKIMLIVDMLQSLIMDDSNMKAIAGWNTNYNVSWKMHERTKQ